MRFLSKLIAVGKLKGQGANPFKRELGRLDFNRSASGWQSGKFLGHLLRRRSLDQSAGILEQPGAKLYFNPCIKSIKINLWHGDFFSGGVSGDILAMCIEYDGKYSLKELRAMWVDAGLAPGGHKKLLAAKLLARQKRG